MLNKKETTIELNPSRAKPNLINRITAINTMVGLSKLRATETSLKYPLVPCRHTINPKDSTGPKTLFKL